MLDHNSTGRVQQTLAQNLRRLRIARHLSLSELARGTAISKATLSSIENGRANPTVETLVSLARTLRISLGELLEEPPLGEVRVVRARDHDSSAGRVLESFAPMGGLTLAEVVIEPREIREADAGPAGSRVHIYVLAGQLLAGPVERVSELGAGDYAAFPTDVPHLYEATRALARILVLAEEPK